MSERASEPGSKGVAVIVVHALAAVGAVALVSISAGGATNIQTTPSRAIPKVAMVNLPVTVDSCRQALSCARSRPAPAARYVAPSGSDSSPGTLKRPWRTIAKAMRTLAPGTTAYLRAGVYREATDRPCGVTHNTLEWNRSGRPGAPITISGYPGEERRVIVRTKLKLNGDRLRLVRLVVGKNSAYHPVDKACTGDANVNVYGDDVELVGLEVRDSNNSGIYLSGADRTRILSNWVHDNGAHPRLDHGVYFGSGNGGIIANNLVENNLAYGLHMYPRPSGQTIIQNTIVGSGQSGIVVATTGGGIVIVNNISAWNDEYGIRTDGDGCQACWADQNILFGNQADYYVPEPLTIFRTIRADPRFVNRARRDYHLAPGSPAIDSARGDYSRPFDIEGRRRNRGGGPDIGSFER